MKFTIYIFLHVPNCIELNNPFAITVLLIVVPVTISAEYCSGCLTIVHEATHKTVNIE